MSRRTCVAFFVAFSLLLAGCGDTPSQSASSAMSPQDLTREYTKSLNTGDTEPVLATLHPESPQREKTRVELKRLNRMYDLSHKLESLDVLEESDTETRVRFVHRTRADEPDFRDNRFTGVHVLRKHDGSWKIYETRTLELEYLDESDD